MELHVWGDTHVSPLFPECVAAAAWTHRHVPGEVVVVALSNTNLSPSGRLPVLRHRGVVVDGYALIVEYLHEQFPDRSPAPSLEDLAMVAFAASKLELIAQYVLYCHGDNYAGYTRAQFKHYLPFPMMYNQPLQFAGSAERWCETVGLHEAASFMPSFGGSGATPSAPVSDADEVVLSKLHAAQTLKKQQERRLVREYQFAMRSLRIMKEYMDELGAPPQPPTAGSVRVAALLASVCNPQLPDGFMRSFVEELYPEWFAAAQALEDDGAGNALEAQAAQPADRPTLWNEACYWAAKVAAKVAA